MKVHYILGDAPPSGIAQDSILSEISLQKLGVKPILGDVSRRGIAQKRSYYKIQGQIYVKFPKKKIPHVAPKGPYSNQS